MARLSPAGYLRRRRGGARAVLKKQFSSTGVWLLNLERWWEGGTVIKEAVLDMVRFFLSWMSWSTLEHGREVRLEEEEKEK